MKSQGKCGSCMAFATISAIESCFKKATGHFKDFSEQQLIDCAYKFHGADGCVGAGLDSYLEWIMVNPDMGLVTEEQYLYQGEESDLSCPEEMPEPRDTSAYVTGYYALSNGNEEILKAYVSEHGVAISTLSATTREFKDYREGIFEGCEPGLEIDHAVTVVGYGTSEDGVDYWLVKNSWGIGWGDEGFMRLKRGVHMCGIGKHIAHVECAAAVLEDNELSEEFSDTDEEEEEIVGSDEVNLSYDKNPGNSQNYRDSSVNCANYSQSLCRITSFNKGCQKFCNSC